MNLSCVYKGWSKTARSGPQWSSVIKSWSQASKQLDFDEALRALDLFLSHDAPIPKDILYRVLKGCIAKKDFALGRRVHALTISSGNESDPFLANHVIRMYASLGRLGEATQVFSKLSTPDTFLWASIISAYGEHGRAEQAIQLYNQMRRSTVKPNDYIFVAVLKACTSAQDLVSGRKVHGDVLDSVFGSNVFVGNSLVDMYGKCGSLEDARAVFDRLPIKTVVSWTAMISGYAQHGLGQDALNLYSTMQQDGMTAANEVTFVCLLKACASIRALGEGKQLHRQIQQRGLGAHLVVGSSLVDMYAKCGSLEDARVVFDQLSKKNVVTWGAMIAGYAQHGRGQEALNLYDGMQKEGIRPDNVVIACSLKACASTGDIQKGKELHYDIQERGLEGDLVVANSLVDMYAKIGNLHDARSVLDRLPSKNVATWTAMIAGYAQHGCGQEALLLYEKMQQDATSPANKVTFVYLLKACASIGAKHAGMLLHSQIQERGLQADLVIGSSLVDMYAKCGSLEDARRVFDVLSAKDVVTWNAMISGYAHHGLVEEALNIFAEMQHCKVPASDVTFVYLLKACASSGAIHEGKQLHKQIEETGLERNLFVGNTLVDMYARCGSMGAARILFDRLPTKDVVTWTALINGYSQHNDCKMAMQCFEEMVQHGVEPDGATFLCLLVACSHVGLVTEGQRYFKMMTEEHGMIPTVDHFSCMVDLLGRAGRLHEAEDMLRRMPFEADKVAWTSLLTNCKSHCDVERGRRCFDRLLELEPDDAGAYVLMTGIYANAARWDDVAEIEILRKGAGAWKKAAKACIEINSSMHEFIVGEDRGDTSSKLRSMNLRLKEEGHVPHTELVLKPIAEQEKEDALCGHAEKVALAYGLLNTSDGTTLLVNKNLRMCNNCHNSTKILSRIERREIIVRDSHRVHHFKDGLCSCGDSH